MATQKRSSGRRASSPSMHMMMDMYDDENYVKGANIQVKDVQNFDIAFSRQTTEEPDDVFSRLYSYESQATEPEVAEVKVAAPRRRTSSPSMHMMMDMHEDENYVKGSNFQENDMQNFDIALSRQTTEEPDHAFSRQCSYESHASEPEVAEVKAATLRRRASSPSIQMMMDMEEDEHYINGTNIHVKNVQNFDIGSSRQIAEEPDDIFSRLYLYESQATKPEVAEVKAAAPRRRASSPSIQMMMDMEEDEKYHHST